jgi:hypothetical protein
MRSGHAGWSAVSEWSLSFALVALGVLSLPSIGVFVLPVALALLAVVALRNRPWPEAGAGGLLGIGAAFLFVAYRSLDYVPCASAPIELGPGQTYTCGGWDPLPWLLLGAMLASAGLLGYLGWRAGWWNGKRA